MSHLPVLFCLVLLSLPAAAIDKLIPVTQAQRASLRIATVPVTAHAWAVSVGLPATVVVPPAQERVVAAPLAGLVTELCAAPGDSVAAGQVLAVLKSSELASGQQAAAQAAIQLRLAEQAAQRD